MIGPFVWILVKPKHSLYEWSRNGEMYIQIDKVVFLFFNIFLGISVYLNVVNFNLKALDIHLKAQSILALFAALFVVFLMSIVIIGV